MRARTVMVVLGPALAVAGCRGVDPPVVRASEVEASPSVTASATATADAEEARLAELRASDQFDEFAEHERAAKADGARLAWENFAPVVDGERVEWTNKAELWDSIAPKIRDEALLLGPEYRQPLWNNTNAIPCTAGVPWIHFDTGRGDYVEFLATYLSETGAAERVWGFLVSSEADGRGVVIASMAPLEFFEADYSDIAARADVLQGRTWQWIESQETV